MAKVHSKALDQSITVDRIIGHIRGSKQGPTVVFIAGIHGNEPSGVFALHEVFRRLQPLANDLSGNFYGVAGNLWALERGVRFEENDLNRLWLQDRINQLDDGTFEPVNEDERQQADIYQTVKQIISTESGPFYFMDLHSTSSPSIPFMTVNDSLLNRHYTSQYPLPIVLGIEEYLDGPILSYMNELGYVAFGYEGGQHDDLAAIDNHIAFISLSLAYTGIAKKQQVDFDLHFERLSGLSRNLKRMYEIHFRYKIESGERFTMKPGFVNFQYIPKGCILATSDGVDITNSKRSRIFMPLYQSQGIDGYFVIRRIPPFFLWLSAMLRRMRADKLLPILPGVKWTDSLHETLEVNIKVARFLAKDIFHLLGYRYKKLDESHWIMKNREERSRSVEYVHSSWY
ncbi:MAG: succinylglutamate desuccinylase/aspartoacylase family protein [Bacteroidota bacterium]